MKKVKENFEEVETTKEYDGYYYEVAEVISIVVLGSLCGLKNMKQVHQWATNERTREFLRKEQGIERIPCYYWFLCLLKLVKPESLNRCVKKWAERLVPEERKTVSVALDGKTVRSTRKMDRYENPLHIISAQLCEMGITQASRSTDGKSNEIPAVQELLKELDISGCLVAADALNCQKKTAKAVVDGKGDYLLSVKGNHAELKADIADYVRYDSLRKSMDTYVRTEKNRGRLETRTAFAANDIAWLPDREKWPRLCCIGAIHTEFEEKGQKTSQWHDYSSSRELTARELLHHARMEWAAESMHWLLNVHFGEDFCCVEDKAVQQNLNILRKFALSIIKIFKQRTSSKRPLSHIMFDCLLNPFSLPALWSQN